MLSRLLWLVTRQQKKSPERVGLDAEVNETTGAAEVTVAEHIPYESSLSKTLHLQDKLRW